MRLLCSVLNLVLASVVSLWCIMGPFRNSSAPIPHDSLQSVKYTGVSQPRWAIWREIWKWSCLPSLLYCISRKTVDAEYTYYSWCMTSTDIVKWRKTNDYENFEKRGYIFSCSREKGGRRKQNPCPMRLWSDGRGISDYDWGIFFIFVTLDLSLLLIHRDL